MIDQQIIRFIKRHHVLTLATTGSDGAPYCANAFYCYDTERNILIFASDITTRHAVDMELHPRIAASILLETRIIGKIQGLQLCGTAAHADDEARRAYLRRFPYTAMTALTLWVVTPDYMKFTDNTLGFGKKLIWNA